MTTVCQQGRCIEYINFMVLYMFTTCHSMYHVMIVKSLNICYTCVIVRQDHDQVGIMCLYGVFLTVCHLKLTK